MVQAQICSTAEAGWEIIEAHVAELVAAGKVIDTQWPGEPLMISPLPAGRDVWYDPDRVERVLDVLAQFDQIKGRWAGRPLAMFDWQVRWEIAPVFGLVRWEEHENGSLFDDDDTDDLGGQFVRIIREAWFEKPRKNGKSTECSGLGLYLAFSDGEQGAEVYAAARNKDQAKLVFTPARVMAERCAPLRKMLGHTGITKNLLENPNTGSIFRPLASDMGGALHGLNVSGAVIDEVHVHKTSDTIDALDSGVGSRLQPLIVYITTADEGRVGSIYDTKRTYVEGLCSGAIEDESMYAVVFAASEAQMEGNRAFSDETLIAANPGVGFTVTMPYLRNKAKKAKGSPAELNKFLRLHLGKRTKQAVAWFEMGQWDTAMGMVTDREFRRAKGYGGIDLSSTTDFTAAAILCPDPKRADVGGVFGKVMIWVPGDRVKKLTQLLQVPLQRWIDEGFVIATEGNVVDYTQFRADLSAEVKRLGVTLVEIGYDPYNAAETVQEMQGKNTMVPIRQGFLSLSAPSKEVHRLIEGSTPEAPLLRMEWNPCLRWMASCVEVLQDPAGNIKPNKPDRRAASTRIDGIAAIVTAMARLTVRPKRRKAASGTG